MRKISVAMGTYNGADFLLQQLESLAAQTHLPHELQVGDDGSSDATLAILADFARGAPFPVQVTRNDERLGYGENFLRTAARCSGDWIAFCDQDDYWHADKLDVCAQAIDAAPADLMLLIHDAVVGDSALNPIGHLRTPPGVFAPLSLPPEWVARGFTQIVRASIISDYEMADRAMPWLEFPDAHDAWTFLLASISGTVIVMPTALATYRRHESNITAFNSNKSAPAATPAWRHAKGALRIDTDSYRESAELMYTVSRYLFAREARAATAEQRGMFERAARTFEKRGRALDLRMATQGSKHLSTRLRSFSALLRGGYYAEFETHRFAWKSALKDLSIAVLPLQRTI